MLSNDNWRTKWEMITQQSKVRHRYVKCRDMKMSWWDIYNMSEMWATTSKGLAIITIKVGFRNNYFRTHNSIKTRTITMSIQRLSNTLRSDWWKTCDQLGYQELSRERSPWAKKLTRNKHWGISLSRESKMNGPCGQQNSCHEQGRKSTYTFWLGRQK